MSKLLKCLSLIILFNYVGANHRARRIVGGSPAAVPPYDDPSVYLRFAGRTARVKGVQDYPHYVFRGIRYAYPPVGKERFLRPKQFFLEGDVDATTYPPPCLQPVPNENRIVGSEDCLFLNVFTPDLPLGTEGLPVVVWIHGGGFRYGSASQYGVRQLVGKQLIVVTIQYRLGSLGFFGTGTQELPGNAALWDMVMAVQWIRNHIGFFGGNPYQVTVMGHGTGASSALLAALNNVAKGHIHGVIALSGTAVSPWATNNQPKVTAEEVANMQGCPTVSVKVMLKCMQTASAARIIIADSQIEFNRIRYGGFVSGFQGRTGSMPTVEGQYDGYSLPPMVEGEPLEKMTKQDIPKIPLLTGVTRDETKRAVHGQYQNEIKEKLKSVPHFLDQILVQNLQGFLGLGGENLQDVFSMLDPLNFRGYVTTAKDSLLENLDKVSEMTVDALFNLPAFLTVDLWSKSGAPAFLYRFEHSGKVKNAFHFLKGLPLVGNTSTVDNSDTVGHGDDLAYLFEPRTLEGEPIEGADNFTEEDKKVRDSFVDMIYTFVKNGKINVDGKAVPSFLGQQNQYVQIGPKLKVLKDFRFCQMALWAGLQERLQLPICQFLSVLKNPLGMVGNLPNPIGQVGNVASHLPNPFGQVGGGSSNNSPGRNDNKTIFSILG